MKNCNLLTITLVTLFYYTTAQELTECPEFNGHEEFRQFIRFNEYRADVVGQDLAPEDVMSLIANDNLDNPRWVAANIPFEHDLQPGNVCVGGFVNGCVIGCVIWCVIGCVNSSIGHLFH